MPARRFCFQFSESAPLPEVRTSGVPTLLLAGSIVALGPEWDNKPASFRIEVGAAANPPSGEVLVYAGERYLGPYYRLVGDNSTVGRMGASPLWPPPAGPRPDWPPLPVGQIMSLQMATDTAVQVSRHAFPLK